MAKESCGLISTYRRCMVRRRVASVKRRIDRKDCGMDGSIPFIRVADRVEVTVSLEAKRVSGPPVIFKQ
jgi:hypothetical protein